MPKHHEEQISPYSPAQLYALVANVASYPEFLPWCRAVRILHQVSETEFIAEMVIAYKHLREQYTSRVCLKPAEQSAGGYAIHVTMLEGPFQHLSNAWQFKPLGEGGTLIQFDIDFAFRSRFLEALMGAFFLRATSKMAAAFLQRADTLYSNKKSQPHC